MKKLLAAMAIIVITGSITTHCTIKYLQDRELSFISGRDMVVSVIAPIDFPECREPHLSDYILHTIEKRFTRSILIAIDKEHDKLFDESGVMINEDTLDDDIRKIVLKYNQR